MTEFPHDKQAVAILAERVGEASREAIKEMKEQEASGVGHKGRKRGQSERDDMDIGEDEEEEQGGKRKKKGMSKSKRRR